MSTPTQVLQRVGASETTLYTAFSSGSLAYAELVYLNFCNVSTTDLTVDVYQVNSGSSASRYIVKGYTVPGTGGNQADWRGMVAMHTSGETIKAISSGASIDISGVVIEV